MGSAGQRELASIDVSPLMSSEASRDSREAVLKSLLHASATDGFFLITGHGIPVEQQRHVLECTKRYFNLPMEQKRATSIAKALGMSHRGYEELNGQALEVGGLPDLKEGFNIGSEVPSTDPRAGQFSLGPNQWPSALSGDGFEKPLMKSHESMAKLLETLMQALTSTVPEYLTEDRMKDIMTCGETTMRLLHYPPEVAGIKGQLGVGAHSDIDYLTILLQEHGMPGLQVWSELDEVWIPAPAIEDAFVVNIGNLLQTWTEGHLKSAQHRVINASSKHRYSVAYFYYGDMNAEFTPSEITKSALPSLAQKGMTVGEKTTVGNYLKGVLSAVDTTTTVGATKR